MKKEIQVVIFSDLDGTLINKDTYSFSKAKKALKLIREKKIPLVIVSSKTRVEIEVYRKKLKNNHPFISENGGAIFIPKNYFKFKFKEKVKGKYKVIEFGASYKKLVKVMKKIDKKFGTTSFYELSSEEISKQSGLNKEEARFAKKREYDVVFSIDNKKNKNKILNFIRKKGFNYTKGGRYYHMLGKNNKGKAVRKLIRLYKRNYRKKIFSVGFGDSENDSSLIKKVDEGYFVKGPEDWNRIVIKNLKN